MILLPIGSLFTALGLGTSSKTSWMQQETLTLIFRLFVSVQTPRISVSLCLS